MSQLETFVRELRAPIPERAVKVSMISYAAIVTIAFAVVLFGCYVGVAYAR